MSQLVSIGRFALLCRLTPRALRLYDDLGLLRPARVDTETGYRLYDLDQLGEARRIAELRAIDVPLEEIRRSGAAPREVLERHQDRLRRHLELTSERLAETERLLREVIVTYEIQVRREPARHVLFVREQVVLPETGGVLRGAMNEVCAFADRAGLEVAGASWCAYDLPDEGEVVPPGANETVPVDCVVPVARPATGDGRVRALTLPGCDAAFTRHVGPYSGLPGAFQAVARWVAEHDRELDGALREVYLEHDASGNERHVVEVLFPLKARRR